MSALELRTSPARPCSHALGMMAICLRLNLGAFGSRIGISSRSFDTLSLSKTDGVYEGRESGNTRSISQKRYFKVENELDCG